MVKNTTTASVGVLSIATDGTDYLSPDMGRHMHLREAFDGLATGDINGLGSYYQCGAWATNNAATCTTEVAVKAGAAKMLPAYGPSDERTGRGG